VNRQEFWDVIEQARADAGSAAADAVAARATEVLALLPPAQIAAAAQPLWDLMADSYRVICGRFYACDSHASTHLTRSGRTG
jgi:hypothetical protein